MKRAHSNKHPDLQQLLYIPFLTRGQSKNATIDYHIKHKTSTHATTCNLLLLFLNCLLYFHE